MPLSIKTQYVYYDKKCGAPTPKAKLASVVVAGVHRFFELTSRQSRVNVKHRVDFKKSHLENLVPNVLNKEDGCIIITRPEFIPEADLLYKINDPKNGFREIARLCDEKWREIQKKTESPKIGHGHNFIPKEERKELIIYTHVTSEANKIIRQLNLD